jgi:hypothetical protein
LNHKLLTMKTIKFLYILPLALLISISCEQELITLEPPVIETPVTTGTSGTASFTKFVTVGNSFVAGMQGQALFNDGQANSMAKIVATQLATSGGSATFNQPDINSVNGFNPISSNLGIGLVLGRLVLFDPDGTGPRTAAPAPAKFPGSSVTCPSPLTTPALPAPYNTADLPGAFTGNKAALNNFGVPLIYLAQTLTPATGGPPPPAPNPAYSPFYARFASSPSPDGSTGSRIITDAKAAAGSFYLIWLGFDDVLLYAATGAANTGQPSPPAGTYPMTSSAAFTGQLGVALNDPNIGLLTGTSFKGVIGNIPNFTSLPYFYTVAWNTITLDAATATSLTTNLAANYNAFLDAMVTNTIITAEERTKRKLTFVAGKNGVLLSDDVGFSTGGLTDLSPYMAGPYAGLLPYALARQATATDLIPLAAGSVLGTCYGGSAQAVYGVSFPVPDQYVLTPAETTAILTRTAEFNAAIAAAVAASGDRLALADVNKGFADFVTAKAAISNGVTITPSFAPPTGAFSEDGLHPNARGNAFTANIFISAINAKFGATVPKADLSKYSGTALPVNP